MAPEQRDSTYVEPPYRLTTIEQIRAAIKTPPPGFTRTHMGRVQRLASQVRLQSPPALSVLPQTITLRLYQFRTQLVRVSHMDIRTSAELSLERDPALFAPYMPFVQRIARESDLVSFLSNLLADEADGGLLPGRVRDQLREQLTQARYHLVVRTMANHLRSLCKALLKSGAGDREQVRKFRFLLLAHTLFAVGNDDVLNLIRKGLEEGPNSVTLHNGMAELLFRRVPIMLYKRVLRPQAPIESFVRRLEHMRLTVYQRNALTTMVRAAADQETWARRLRAAERAARTFQIPEDEQVRLLGMLGNLQVELTRAHQLFEEVVLEQPLRPLCAAYRQHPLALGVKVHFTVQMRRFLCTAERLVLYPTKDYMDLLKGRFSSDCTSEAKLALAHLSEPRFFNMRIFRNQEWIGNFYCLDLGDVAKAIVIDRIQIPRTVPAVYHQFFPVLSRAFERVLRKTPYRYVMIAPDVSNHLHVRRLLAAYIRSRRPKSLELTDLPGLRRSFESFSGERPRFYVLVDLEELQRARQEARRSRPV
ncbi:MAG: hypothetical protein ONB17_07275 [candidate division KSB1 bacterium]|nr:hypothetical protein [candidate division KSB1 bacterium]